MTPRPSIAPRNVPRALNALRFLASFLLAGLALTANGQDSQEINRLIRAGQLGTASEKVDALLAKNPKDAQARFQKGVILSEQGRQTDAIGVFQALTEDYPELPEPYNNLASLYAAKGQYEKAKTALEMAIQVNPSYGTAYENLGDVYAKLASQAYDKALQLDRANSTASAKLAAIRGAFAPGAKPAATPATAPRGDAGKAQPMATSAATSIAAAPPTKSPTNAGATMVPVAAMSSASKAPATPSAPAPAGAAGGDTASVLQAVNTWIGAWSTRDVDGYLAAYSRSFAPEGKSRDEWEALRRSTFPATGPVHVTIEQPQVNMLADNQAEVTFVQHYRSERVRLNTRKSLRLSKEDGAWHIAEERILR